MLKFRCAWRGCFTTCDDPAELPEGWIALVTFRKTVTPGLLDFIKDHVLRDAVLCPKHAPIIDHLLEQI